MPILVAPQAPPEIDIPTTWPTQVSWVSSEGEVIRLTAWEDYSRGIMVAPGVLGHLMPNWTFYSDQSPAFDGETIRGVRAGPRQVTIPLRIWGDDRPECLNLLANLLSALNPQNGIGTLIFTEPSGQSFSIPAYYESGFEGDDDDDKTGRTWVSAAVVFRAPRPFWEGEVQSVTFFLAAAGGTFLPLLPLAVSDSAVVGSLVAQNLGNVWTYPTWTITGPCSSITLANTSTGKSLVINKALIAGDVAVINTQEGIKTAVLNGVTNLYEWMTVASSLWPLRPGANNVVMTLPGATSATTVQMAYRSRYIAAVA